MSHLLDAGASSSSCAGLNKVVEQLGNVRAQHLVYGLDSINNTSTVFDEN